MAAVEKINDAATAAEQTNHTSEEINTNDISEDINTNHTSNINDVTKQIVNHMPPVIENIKVENIKDEKANLLINLKQKTASLLIDLKQERPSLVIDIKDEKPNLLIDIKDEKPNLIIDTVMNDGFMDDQSGDHNTRKRKVFTISDKVHIIRDLERGKSQSRLARELDIQQSTVSRMWKNRHKIISAYENDQINSKRLRYTSHKLEDSLQRWISHQRRSSNPPVLKPKPPDYPASCSVNNVKPFSSMEGWLQCIAIKNNISFSNVLLNGEQLTISSDPTTDWLNNTWLSLRKDYTDHDIFHLDEMGLFFRLPPDKITSCLGEQCFGGKLASERLTIVLTTNMTGSEKRRLLVIGKQENIQMTMSVRHVRYVTNPKSWMSSEIFETELRRWDSELLKHNRRILLLVNDCSAHPLIHDLNRIKLVYLPYRVAAVRQPMGRGIFRSFKTHYRRQLLLSILPCLESKTKPVITIYDAIRMIYKAWVRVPVRLIKNCFLQSGLMKSASNSEVLEEYEDDIPLSDWLKQYNLTQFEEFKNSIDWYVEVDCEVQTSQEIDESEMSRDEGEEANGNDSAEEPETCQEDAVQKKLTISQALRSLREVSQFFEQQNSSSAFNQVLSIENTLEKMILNTQKVKPPPPPPQTS